MNRHKLKTNLLGKYGKKCAYCGRDISMTTMTIDHILPTALGGSFDWDNLNPCCGTCNEFKKDLDLEDFRKDITHQQTITETKRWFDLLSSYGMVTMKYQEVIFYFERISNV